MATSNEQSKSNFGILNKVVSYQDNTWSSISKEITIKDALAQIKSTKHKPQVISLRRLLQDGNKERYDSHKKTLPAITFCGSFNGERKKASLKVYNSILVLDVDKLSQIELKRTKECFQNDNKIFSFWESPSQEGIKGLVALKYNFELTSDNIEICHKSAFKKLSSYFLEEYNISLDSSGSDTTRLCFFSHDPLLVLKEQIINFEINSYDIEETSEKVRQQKNIVISNVSDRDILYNPKERNNPSDRFILNAIIKYLEKKKTSITNSYEAWYKVGMAIANSFTYDLGEKYFLGLSSLDKDKFNDVNCKNFLRNCYEARSGAVKFSTIVFYANEKGYLTKKQRVRGSEVVDESLSQVSSSKTVIHLPEDLKK